MDLTVPQAIRELGRIKGVKIEVEEINPTSRIEGSKEANQVFKVVYIRPPTRNYVHLTEISVSVILYRDDLLPLYFIKSRPQGP